MGAVSQSAARLVHLDVQKDTATRSYRLTISHEIIFGNVVSGNTSIYNLSRTKKFTYP